MFEAPAGFIADMQAAARAGEHQRACAEAIIAQAATRLRPPQQKYRDAAAQSSWDRGEQAGKVGAKGEIDECGGQCAKSGADQRGNPIATTATPKVIDASCRLHQTLKRAFRRASDIAVRYGGEEFACVLPGLKLDEAMQVAHTISERIRALGIPHEQSDTAPFRDRQHRRGDLTVRARTGTDVLGERGRYTTLRRQDSRSE